MIDIIRQHARLHILSDLAEQPNGSWNSDALRDDLEARVAIARPLDWVHNELLWLEDMGAVKIMQVSAMLIAKITQRGLDHVERRRFIDGVKRPALED